MLEEFKNSVMAGDNDSAKATLSKLERQLLDLDSLPPLCLETPTAAQDREMARDAFEHAVILSVNMQEKEMFQKYMSCLRPYYTTFKRNGASEIMSSIMGLNLLYLLVENRLADFHCQLELLSEAEKQLPTVVFCTRLDQHLVVGSYDQVLEAAANPPTKYFSFFLKSLLETVRINIGECAAAAYKSITVAAITQVLMFDKEEATLEFIADFYPTWEVDSMQGVVTLSGTKGASKADDMPSLKLISQNLSYATELERIV